MWYLHKWKYTQHRLSEYTMGNETIRIIEAIWIILLVWITRDNESWSIMISFLRMSQHRVVRANEVLPYVRYFTTFYIFFFFSFSFPFPSQTIYTHAYRGTYALREEFSWKWIKHFLASRFLFKQVCVHTKRRENESSIRDEVARTGKFLTRNNTACVYIHRRTVESC